jgi:predicted metal-dependent phosphoesterase TrpH
VIDLHLHTTASDGSFAPRELVDRAAAAGITIMAVTDHDTTAAIADVQASARERRIEALAGIEITAVEDGRDIHVLGYFLDANEPALITFLQTQRETRISRVHAIAARLAELGVPIDVQKLLDEASRQPGRSIGRPQVARALQRAGHVADSREAFDRFLGSDAPAFVSRPGAPPEIVVGIIHRAGGLASLAHPGRTRIDARIPALAAAGLDCLEVYHSDHDETAIRRYGEMASALGLLMTGGSDFHGDPAHGLEVGAATLPAAEWRRLSEARHRHAVR